MEISVRACYLLTASAVVLSAVSLSGCGARTALGPSFSDTAVAGATGTGSEAGVGGATTAGVGGAGSGAQGSTSGGNSTSSGGGANAGGGINAGGGPSCEDTCSLGDSRCSGGDLSTCVAGADGCSEWGVGVVCGAHQTCQSGAAQAFCSCDPGAVPIAGACAVIASPRPVAPLSTATVTSQTPRFHWALAASTDGAQVEIFRDRACTQAVTSFLASGTSGAPSTRLKKGLYYWRVRGAFKGSVGLSLSPVWEFSWARRARQWTPLRARSST